MSTKNYHSIRSSQFDNLIAQIFMGTQIICFLQNIFDVNLKNNVGLPVLYVYIVHLRSAMSSVGLRVLAEPGHIIVFDT